MLRVAASCLPLSLSAPPELTSCCFATWTLYTEGRDSPRQSHRVLQVGWGYSKELTFEVLPGRRRRHGAGLRTGLLHGVGGALSPRGLPRGGVPAISSSCGRNTDVTSRNSGAGRGLAAPRARAPPFGGGCAVLSATSGDPSAPRLPPSFSGGPGAAATAASWRLERDVQGRRALGGTVASAPAAW